MSEPTTITTGEALDIMSRQAQEIARLRGAGNALAAVAESLRDGSSSNRRANLTVALDAWRSAAGSESGPQDDESAMQRATAALLALSDDDRRAVIGTLPLLARLSDPRSAAGAPTTDEEEAGR